jgi:AbrB family looped-hinge helix DNA binding protein
MQERLSSVSPKGQITIPAEIRRLLGVKPRDKLAIRVVNGVVTIVPVLAPLDASYQAVPALKEPHSWKELEKIAAEEMARSAADESS